MTPTTSFAFAGHGAPSIPVGPIVYGSKGSLHGERLFLDGQEPTTLDDHFARHGSADAERLFPRGLSDPFGLLIGDWLANREDTNVGNIVNSVPNGVETLLANYRLSA